MMTGLEVVPIAFKGFIGFYKVITKEHPEPYLDEKLLKLFRAFKESYDNKSASRLAHTISPEYEGTFYDCGSKDELVEFFEEAFDSLPFFSKLRLIAQFHDPTDGGEGEMSVFTEFESKLTVAGIPVPFTSFDFGSIIVTVKPANRGGRYLITRMDDPKKMAKKKAKKATKKTKKKM